MAGASDLIVAVFKAAAPATAAQGLSLSRASIQGIGGAIVTAGITAPDWRLILIGAVTWIAPVIWGQVAHSPYSQAASVSAMPGVKVMVDPKIAPEGAVQAAKDPTLPNVKVAP